MARICRNLKAFPLQLALEILAQRIWLPRFLGLGFWVRALMTRIENRVSGAYENKII